MVDSKVLKARLSPVVSDTAADIKEVLTGIARVECRKVAEALAERNAVLTERPEDLDGFMAYQIAHAEQSRQRQAALAQVERVRPPAAALPSNADTASVHSQLAMPEL